MQSFSNIYDVMSYSVNFVDAGFENHKKKVITLNKIPIRTIM